MSPARERPLRLGVLASGSGSNLQALLDACASGAVNATVAAVICNVPGAKCLERAQEAGVPALELPHKGSPSREAYDEKVVAALRACEVELVCLAGFMRLVTPVLLSAFPDRVLNIHPSLLPSFPGLHAVEQALNAGARISGCTVHFVDTGTDTGPILIQAAVPILDGDSADSLAQRIHVQEHRAYVRAVQLVADDAIEWTQTASGKRRPQIRLSANLPQSPLGDSTSSLVSPPLLQAAGGAP